jgi:hypothetical protein
VSDHIGALLFSVTSNYTRNGAQPSINQELWKEAKQSSKEPKHCYFDKISKYNIKSNFNDTI